MKYICKQSFTNNGLLIPKDTIWDYEPDYASTNDAKLYMTDIGNDDDPDTYIDIDYKTLDNYFERVE